MRSSLRLCILVAATILFCLPGRAVADPGPEDPPRAPTPYEMRNGWFSRDKANHFTLSTSGSAVLYAIGREAGLGRWTSAIAAAAITAAAGTLREVLATGEPDQWLTRSHFSRRDMVWNGAGILVGITVTDLRLGSHWADR